jgi:hypothetical protein
MTAGFGVFGPDGALLGTVREPAHVAKLLAEISGRRA